MSAALAPLHGFAAEPAAQRGDECTRVEAVGPIGFTVSDLDQSVAFFGDVLTFTTEGEFTRTVDGAAAESKTPCASARVARMQLGDETLELTEYTSSHGRPFPVDSRSNDLWFQHIAIIVSDMDRAYARLLEHGVRPASKGGPQTLPEWNKNAAGIKAFYFHDPDGHFLEILQFPPDKGDPKWHRVRGETSSQEPAGKLFLGIDHTAIVVSDTETSLKYYRDRLGLRVVGGSENYGPEQEALNNVPGARLRITTLRADRGPGIELLEYLHPRNGRVYPADAWREDLLHWETGLDVRASGDLTPEAQTSRDPDAHVMKLVYHRPIVRPLRPPG